MTPLILISQIVVEWVDRWIAEESITRGDEPGPPQVSR
jgi:hypothetical protein